MSTPDDSRYPVGRFQRPTTFTPENRFAAITVLAELPRQLRDLVAPLEPKQWEQRYRAGGWTIRELVHHLADSHLNAYCRIKMALTETNPAIVAYDEAKWAQLADNAAPPAVSLQLLDSLHQRWTTLLRQLPESDFSRCYNHPEQGLVSIDACLALYAWHCRHHAAHIRQAIAQPVA
ncbi:MAG TPA: putative metal-dependent hydrolase [Terriglobales bacterium]|nr:putative metal-dependent hydrolase [Terriglobales bacterium]